MALGLDDLPAPDALMNQKDSGDSLSLNDLPPPPKKTSNLEAGVRGAVDFATFGLDKYAEGLARTAYKSIKGEEEFSLSNISKDSKEAGERSETSFNEHKAAYRTGEVVAGVAMLAKTLVGGGLKLAVEGAGALAKKAGAAGVEGAAKEGAEKLGVAGDALKALPGEVKDVAGKGVDFVKGTVTGKHGPIRSLIEDFIPNATEKQKQRIAQAAALYVGNKALGAFTDGDSKGDHKGLARHLIDALEVE